MIHAAGILLRSKENRVLLLKRGDGGDYPGTWCCPGGGVEDYDHDDLKRTAIRETLEEVGQTFKAENLESWTRTISPTPDDPEGVDFETFLHKGRGPEFTPTLSDEHTAFAWCDPKAPPEPLHPGAAIALERFEMHETDAAEAIRDGRLTSPQEFQGITLIAIRITGTGMSYRSQLKEHVWRDRAIYLNDDFLRRCQGLPVILEHPPDGKMLDTDEYAERNVGSIVLPYIVDDEVWGIAQIRDGPTARLLADKKLSTSPGVSFRSKDNTEVPLEEGEHLLIEGVPSLLDHIAICEQGVWDKGGEPSGVAVNDGTGVSTVAEEREDKRDAESEEEKARTEREDAIRRDAEEKADKRMDAVADRMLNALDKLEKRVDAMEKRADSSKCDEEEKEEREDKRKDESEEEAKETAADKRKDESEKEEKSEEREDGRRDRAMDSRKDESEDKEEREDKRDRAMDSKRKDEEHEEREDRRHDALARRITDVERALPKRVTESERAQLLAAQARADRAYAAYNDAAPRFMEGESLMEYRRRLAAPMQRHSTTWKDANIFAIADSATFDIAENAIYNDAVQASRDISRFDVDDPLRPQVRHDDAGRKITEFVGMPSRWMSAFSGRARKVDRIVNPRNQQGAH